MNKYSPLFLLVTGMAFSAHAHIDALWQPRVTLAQSSYDFDLDIDYTEDRNAQDDNSKKTSTQYMALGLGLTAIFEDFYIDGMVQKNISGETGIIYEEHPNVTQNGGVIAYARESSDLDRLDLALAVGMEVIDRLSLYAGYRYGETEFTGGGLGGNFKTKGPYVGATYTIPINNVSAVAIGGSFAQLDGDWQDAHGFKYNSDQTGVSYNISYHHNFFEATGLYIRYSTQSYEYLSDDPGNYDQLPNGTPAFGPARITLDEKIQSIELGVHMRF